jgi:hypothetical protein
MKREEGKSIRRFARQRHLHGIAEVKAAWLMALVFRFAAAGAKGGAAHN